jgi:hypothetical protein
MNLDRVFRYLRGSKGRSISYWRGAEIKISTYIDAAFACHEEQKSRSGCLLMCAGSFVGAWSSKQSVNAFSSTEAELIALSEDCSWVLWVKHWLESQGHKQGAVQIFQDNTSVLSILKRRPSADLRTRYLSIRYFFMGTSSRETKRRSSTAPRVWYAGGYLHQAAGRSAIPEIERCPHHFGSKLRHRTYVLIQRFEIFKVWKIAWLSWVHCVITAKLTVLLISK